MRTAVSILSSIIFAAMLLFAPTQRVRGDELSEAESRRQDPRREWFYISNGRTDFEILDPALVPSRLALAAAQSDCRYAEEMKSTPMHFMSLGGHRLAFVFCREFISGSHRVFDLSNLAKPKPVEFPVLAPPKGFASTVGPGWITQDRETGLFLAETGSDNDLRRIRHVYQFDENRDFVIVRVELQQYRGAEWTTLWDTTPWSFGPSK